MVFHLAGRMAQNKVDDDCQSLEEVLIEGWEDSLCESEEEWRRTTDEGKALEIAEMLSNKVLAAMANSFPCRKMDPRIDRDSCCLGYG